MLCWDVNARKAKYRDLTLVTLDEGCVLVIACDSAGGIGPKELDSVKVPGYVLGRFTARVALMELLAAGAQPIVLVSNVCVEPDPGAGEITRGITEELRLAGLDSSIAVTGSTEKNIPTRQTGLGVTAVGLARSGSLKLGVARPNDRLFCVGIPKVGNEVDLDDQDIATLEAVMALRACPEVHEIVPVGSQGIRREAEVLAQTAGMELHLEPAAGLDVEKSAGPATCFIISAEPGSFLDSIQSLVAQPVRAIGHISPG
jgi:selenophosphate synthetase-related protein